MKNKTLEFVKNGLISSIPFIAGGIVGAEIADFFTDNNFVINASSTINSYIAAYASFMALHARDNRDEYQREDGTWNYKKIVLDTGKLAASLGVAEISYIAGRSILLDYFLDKDFSPGVSSILSDSVMTPFYFGIAIPLAKKIGFIKENKSLEDISLDN